MQVSESTRLRSLLSGVGFDAVKLVYNSERTNIRLISQSRPNRIDTVLGMLCVFTSIFDCISAKQDSSNLAWPCIL
jgi:hypothetical protein